jgi:hypothetical protein
MGRGYLTPESLYLELIERPLGYDDLLSFAYSEIIYLVFLANISRKKRSDHIHPRAPLHMPPIEFSLIGGAERGRR